jgi:hypothetical protein
MIMIEEMSVLFGMVDLRLVAAGRRRAAIVECANCRGLYVSQGKAQGGLALRPEIDEFRRF